LANPLTDILCKLQVSLNYGDWRGATEGWKKWSWWFYISHRNFFPMSLRQPNSVLIASNRSLKYCGLGSCCVLALSIRKYSLEERLWYRHRSVQLSPFNCVRHTQRIHVKLKCYHPRHQAVAQRVALLITYSPRLGKLLLSRATMKIHGRWWVMVDHGSY
jgi:hypothetical protein